jgi:hypothetical protein
VLFRKREGDKVARLKMKDRADVLAAREQFRSDIERKLYGTQGAASAVRKIDVAGIDTAGLVAQLEHLNRDKVHR